MNKYTEIRSRSPSLSTTSHPLPSIGPPVVSAVAAIVASSLVPLRHELTGIGAQVGATAAASWTSLSLSLGNVGLHVLVSTAARSTAATPSTTNPRASLGLTLLLLSLGPEWVLLVTTTTTSSAASRDWKAALKTSKDRT